MKAAETVDQTTDQKTDSGETMRADEAGTPSANGDAPASEDRVERIRKAAYAAAERRGFAPGFETDDWLAAEREIDAGDAQDPNDASKPG